MVIQLACVCFLANHSIFWDYIFGTKPRSLQQKTDRVCNCFSVISMKLIFTLIVPVIFMIDTHKKQHPLCI